MRHSIGWSVVLFFLIAVWETSVLALTAVQRTFDELVVLSEFVLIGTVTSVKSELGSGGDRIYTYVTLSDLEVIKGELHDADYVLRVSGGVVDKRGEFYPGMPQFEEGRRYILFVRGNFHDTFPVVGIHQGIFKVEWDPGLQQEVVWSLHGPVVTSDNGSQLQRGQEVPSPLERDLTVEQFVQRIQERLRTLEQGR